jgi:hypothetical protein
MLFSGRQKSYGSDKLRWEEAEEEKIRLKQYVSLCSKGRPKYVIVPYKHKLLVWELMPMFHLQNQLIFAIQLRLFLHHLNSFLIYLVLMLGFDFMCC